MQNEMRLMERAGASGGAMVHKESLALMHARQPLSGQAAMGITCALFTAWAAALTTAVGIGMLPLVVVAIALCSRVEPNKPRARRDS